MLELVLDAVARLMVAEPARLCCARQVDVRGIKARQAEGGA